MKYAFCNLWSKIHEVPGKGALFLSKDSYNDKNYNTNNINRILHNIFPRTLVQKQSPGGVL